VPANRSFIARFILLLIIFVLMLSAGIYRYYQSELERAIAFPRDVLEIEIPKGSSFNSVLRNLIEKGADINPWVAKVYAKQNKLASKIKAGEFSLQGPMTLPAIFEWLTSNNQIRYQVQFIEGTSYRDALKTLALQEKLSKTLEGKSDDELIQALNSKNDIKHLEGQFYPDTYAYHKGDTDLSILKRAHQRLQNILQEEWQARDKSTVLKGSYEALTLASIVEKETGAAHERAEIAGVFNRRLIKGMRLQTDPTVIYGLGDRYQGNITRKHLKELTAYNTYRIKGLPPSPIALVGRSAIHAALHPKEGSSLYFVAKGDGTHQFSATIDEHNNAVRKYQLRRRKDYRSSQ
jgi:UPF0755 protein